MRKRSKKSKSILKGWKWKKTSEVCVFNSPLTFKTSSLPFVAGGANVVPLIVKSDESSDSDSEEDPHSLHMFPDGETFTLEDDYYTPCYLVSRNVKSSSMGHEKLSGGKLKSILIQKYEGLGVYMLLSCSILMDVFGPPQFQVLTH